MNDYAKDMLQPWWHRPLFYFRWATFIPGGLLGGWLAGVAIGSMSGLGTWMMGGEVLSPWAFLVAAAACGAAAIYAAAQIAPSDNKRTPVVIMATLCTCLWLLGILSCIGSEEWFEGFQCLVALVASIVAAVCIYKESSTTSDSSNEPSTNLLRTDTAL